MSQNRGNWKINLELVGEQIADWKFGVTLARENQSYAYTVILNKDYHKELTGGQIVPAVLVQQTFLFLLSKEDPESILPEFSLKDVTTYFKDFEKEMYDFAQAAK